MDNQEPHQEHWPELKMATIEWWRTRDGHTGLSSSALTLEQVEEKLLELASVVHKKRTGEEATGVILVKKKASVEP